RPGRTSEQARKENEARHPELPAKPDRQRHRAGGDRLGCGVDRRHRRLGALGRGLLPDALRGRVREHRLAAVPEALVDPLTRFFPNSTSCVPPFVQHAGIAALRGPMDEPRAMMAEFARRRELVVDGLNALPGISCRWPRGAFYAFPNVRELPIDADELARRLLDEAGVAVLAGS